MAQAVQSNETPEPERKEPLQDAIPTTKKMQTPSTSTEETNVSYCPSPNRYDIFLHLLSHYLVFGQMDLIPKVT